jgi:hypothetical protein
MNKWGVGKNQILQKQQNAMDCYILFNSNWIIMVSILLSKHWDWQTGGGKRTQLFIAYKEQSSLVKTHPESEMMKKDFPSKHSPKASWSSYAHIWQSRPQIKNRTHKEGHFVVLKGMIPLKGIKL